MGRLVLGRLVHIGVIALAFAAAPATMAQPGGTGGATTSSSTGGGTTREADGMDYGWIGLAGLLGLAGLAGRKRDHHAHTTGDSTRVVR
jgi:hypothetical protein